MTKWQWILSHFANKLWLRASLFCVAGAITALFSFLVKDFIPEDISRKVGAEAVYPILEIIASSMLAVTIFSLSTMVAAYSAATSNATPRSTKLLLEDSTAQTALSTFIGAFLYSLVGIIALHMGIYGNSGRVVLFAVTIAVIVIIVMVLIRWIEHLSRLGRVGQIIEMVEKATAQAVKQHVKEPYLGATPLASGTKEAMPHGMMHPDIGYIQHIDMQQLSELAEKLEITFMVRKLPGSFNDSTMPVIYSSIPLEEEKLGAVRKAFSIDDERSFDQDVRYGFVVLSEIASRALSPAVNDPGTAIAVIGAAVRTLAPWVSGTHSPDVRFPRIHVPAVSLADVFDDIFTPIARSGAGMVEVGVRLQKAYASLAALGNQEVKEQARYYSDISLKRALSALETPEDKDRLSGIALCHNIKTMPDAV